MFSEKESLSCMPKMKGNGEVPWFEVNGISVGVQNIEVVILMNNVWHSL